MITYLCEDTPEGIFTAVCDAWAAKIPDDRLHLMTEQEMNFSLFTEYRQVETDQEKAVKVARSIRQKIANEAYIQVYYASLSNEEDKVDAIYHFLKQGFRYGARVLDMHGLVQVCRVYELYRSVSNENQKYRGFVRFAEIGRQGRKILLARIRPKNQLLPLLGQHFADRFGQENFAIIDDERAMGYFHGETAFLSKVDMAQIDRLWQGQRDTAYEELFQTFFRSIAIKERENYVCQRTMCPIRYRDYMVEFSGGKADKETQMAGGGVQIVENRTESMETGTKQMGSHKIQGEHKA